jgi:flagellar hook-length control protein FliK
VSSVASEAGAVRHAHLGQATRSNFPSAESADQASPFAALVDGASNPSPAPTSLPPASPAPPSQKPAARPPDGPAAQSSPAATAPGPQKSPSNSPAPDNQAGSVSSLPLKGVGDTGIAQTTLGALGKTTAKDTTSTIDANVVTTITNSAAATAGSSTVDATAGSSTAPAIADIHGGKTVKSDSSASDSTQPVAVAVAVAVAAAPTPDPLANHLIPVAPQPVAVPISAPVIAAASTMIGGGIGSGSGTGQDAGQIAAVSNAMAGAPPGQADRAAAAAAKSSGSPTADTGGGTKPGAKKADAATSTPALTPQPTQKDLISPTGAGQPNAADAAQPRNPANEAATNHQHAGTSQPADGTAGPPVNSNGNSNVDPNIDPNVDPKRDPAASANQIQDLTRQALDPTVRRIEAPATESGTPHAADVEAGSAQQSPDGSGGMAAPAILTTSAAPTSAAMTTATPTAIPITGLAVEIVSHARAGKNRFEIRLDPPELGRIDVRLDVDREGKVTSRLVVDRQETLDMLRRDAPELQRSLQQAGLDTADNVLQFSLRDQGAFGGQNPYPDNGSPAAATRLIIPDPELPPIAATMAGYGRTIGTSAGIDIRV